MSEERELPEGWTKAPFADVVENLDGRRIPVKRADRAKRQGKYPYYGASGVIDHVDDYLFEGSHLLIAEDGANLLSRTTPIAFRASGRFWVNNHAHVVLPLSGIPIPFLEAFFGQLDLSQHITGTAQPKLTQKALNKLSVVLPPLNEQNRIVDKIEALQAHSDAAQASLDAIPPLLEKLRQSVLAAAFRGDLTRAWREQNPDVEPASVLLERIRAERKSRFIEDEAEQARAQAEAKAIKAGKPWGAEEDERALAKARVKAEAKYREPEFSNDSDSPTASVFGPYKSFGWIAVPLEGLVDITRGIPYGIVKTGDHIDTGIPTVRCGDIKNFNIDTNSLKRVDPCLHSQYDRTNLRGGEVLVAIRGTVGATAVVGEDMIGMNISREVAMIPLLDGVHPQYISYILSSPSGQMLMKSHVKGVAQSGINLGDLRRLPISLPSIAEQIEIVTQIERIISILDNVTSKVKSQGADINILNQSILAKAFRGELVPQDSTDEPASVLLERIRQERAEAEAAKKGRKGKLANTSSTSTRRGRPRKKPSAEDAPVETVAEVPSRVVNDTSRGEQMDLFEGDN